MFHVRTKLEKDDRAQCGCRSELINEYAVQTFPVILSICLAGFGGRRRILGLWAHSTRMDVAEGMRSGRTWTLTVEEKKAGGESFGLTSRLKLRSFLRSSPYALSGRGPLCRPPSWGDNILYPHEAMPPLDISSCPSQGGGCWCGSDGMSSSAGSRPYGVAMVSVVEGGTTPRRPVQTQRPSLHVNMVGLVGGQGHTGNIGKRCT